MLRNTSQFLALTLVGLAVGCTGRVGDSQGPDQPGPGPGPTECDPGYQLVDGTCQDIDECTASSPCDANAACTNQPGSFACACNDGYTGDGLTCAAVAGRCDDFANFSNVLVNNGCVTCHDQTPGVEGGNLDLLSPGLEERLVNRVSGKTSCADELIIDAASPGDSMLLKLIDPSRYAAWAEPCTGMMPFNTNGVSPADVTCFEEWVQETVENYTPPPPPPPPVFDAMPASSVLAKTKFILHGGAVTGADLEAATNDEGALDVAGLKTLIQGWATTSEFQSKMEGFLRLALQQTEINPRTANRNQAYRDQFDPINNNNGDIAIDRTRFLDSLDEIFVRTGWDIVSSGRDFREVVTTRRWKVTTAILAALVYTETDTTPNNNRFKLLAHLTPADYADWRDVNFTQAADASEVRPYQNTAAFVNGLRNIADGGSLALRAPRVGFFNSPTFFENWETNPDNQFRVATNQAILAALDILFEAGDTTPQDNENGLAAEHAPQDTACYQCHRLLDPMRLQYQNVYTIRYRMRDNVITDREPSFAFQGHTAPTQTMDQFAQALVNHPRFAVAWVQKLCMWANSQRCVENDPEFLRLVTFFQQDYNLMNLLVELFASPLTTGVESTQTHETNEFFVSIARSNHLCNALQTRIRQARTDRCEAERAADPDANPAVCNQRNNIACNANNQTRAMADLISRDAFGRGSSEFIQESLSGPFNARALTELCTQLANREVGGGDRTFTQGDVNGSIDRMVRFVMGMPATHPRYQATRDGLRRAYDIGRATPVCSESGGDVVDDNATDITCGFGLNAQRALYIPWILACSSPELAGQGL